MIYLTFEIPQGFVYQAKGVETILETSFRFIALCKGSCNVDLPSVFQSGRAISFAWLEGRISSLHFNLGSGGPVDEQESLWSNILKENKQVLGTKGNAAMLGATF